MKKTLSKHLILALLWEGVILNNGYGMEQNPHHNQETIIPQTIRSHQMLLPAEEVMAIPSEISKLFLNEIHDDKDIASFWATCRAWKIIGDSYYTGKNKEEHIFPWKECPHLPPRILNRLNTDYRFLLGMHKNIILHNVAKSDRTRFEITCEHIQNTPLLPKKSLIKSFAEMLQLHLYTVCPTVHQNNIDSHYKSRKKVDQIIDNKIAKVGIEVSTIRNQQNISFQNEIVLYFYCASFNKERYGINVIRKDPFFQKLTCNLFDVIKNHDRLLDLQKTDDKTDQLWKEQIDLDCAPTCRDYNSAGFAHFNANKYQKAITYFNMEVTSEKKGKIDKPSLYSLRNIAVSYLHCGNYHNAADYYDQFFSECSIQGEEANKTTAITEYELGDLKDAARVHKELGNKDKEAHYLWRIEAIETAEALRLIDAREKEEEEATKKLRQAAALREKKEAQAAEALLQAEAHKEKKGKKDKKEKKIYKIKK